MKTLRKIGLSFMAVILCLGMASCSSDDDDETPATPTTEEDPIGELLNMPTDVVLPKSSNYVLDPIKIELSEEGSGYKSITLTNNKLAYVELADETETRAPKQLKIISGTYKLNRNNEVIVSLPGNTTITFEYPKLTTDLRQVIINDRIYKATMASLASTGIVTLDNLTAISWQINEYRAIVMFDKLVAYNKSKKTLSELEADVKSKLDIKTDFNLLNYAVLCMCFWDGGFWYAAGESWNDYEGKCGYFTWKDQSKGKMTVTLDDKKYEVDVRFKNETLNGVSVNCLYFILSADFSVIGKQGVHDVSGKLVIKMTDTCLLD